MASKIEVVIQKAIRTFRKPVRKVPECSPAELNELQSLADEVTRNDISKLSGLLNNGELNEFLKKKKTSMDYLSVYEDDSISVGVFLLAKGAKLPLHDHPDMYGIIKVLEGILQISSYSFVELDTTKIANDSTMLYIHPIKAIKHPEVTVSREDQSCLLTPLDKNIHEVQCIEGPAAFLDILSPPYEDGSSDQPRSCHYFEESTPNASSSSSDAHVQLIQVPNPF